MCFEVLEPEIGLAFHIIRPGAAHENLITVHGLLQVGCEVFQKVEEPAGEACVLGGLLYLFGLHHLA